MSIELSNRVFGLHISEEAAGKRDALCPAQHQYLCPMTCPVWHKYGPMGLSCNGALDKYPDDVIRLLTEQHVEGG